MATLTQEVTAKELDTTGLWSLLMTHTDFEHVSMGSECGSGLAMGANCSTGSKGSGCDAMGSNCEAMGANCGSHSLVTA